MLRTPALAAVQRRSLSLTSLVTGGAGFIGSNLVRALLDRGDDVIVIDDLSTGRREHLPESPQLTLIEADLATAPDLASVVARCELVFHLAAQVGTTPSIDDPVLDAGANVLGTVRLLDACRGSRVRKIVCSSSAATFGESEGTPIGEDHPQAPTSFYGLSKLAAERYAVLAASLLDLPTVSLRYFNVYGLPMAPSEYAGVITAFLDRLRLGQPLVIYGDGMQTRDFVHVRDVVAANLAAATAGTPGSVYNIGTGVATTVLALAELMSQLAGLAPRLEFQPARAGDVRDSVAAIDLARRALGYEPQYDLRRGLADLWPAAWPAAVPAAG
jgi:UDP-glucose 4-epimerase